MMMSGDPPASYALIGLGFEAGALAAEVGAAFAGGRGGEPGGTSAAAAPVAAWLMAHDGAADLLARSVAVRTHLAAMRAAEAAGEPWTWSPEQFTEAAAVYYRDFTGAGTSRGAGQAAAAAAPGPPAAFPLTAASGDAPVDMVDVTSGRGIVLVVLEQFAAALRAAGGEDTCPITAAAREPGEYGDLGNLTRLAAHPHASVGTLTPDMAREARIRLLGGSSLAELDAGPAGAPLGSEEHGESDIADAGHQDLPVPGRNRRWRAHRHRPG